MKDLSEADILRCRIKCSLNYKGSYPKNIVLSVGRTTRRVLRKNCLTQDPRVKQS